MNYKIDDSELLYMISEENEDARELFYKKYQSTIDVIAKKYVPLVKNSGIELSDLQQEGMLGLTQALNTFSEQKNIKFKTFATRCIENTIVSFVRDCTRNKHKALNLSISIDTTTNTNGVSIKDLITDTSNQNPIEIISNNEEYQQTKVLPFLSEKEREVYLLHIQGFKYREIAALEETTEKAVERTLYRARKKIEKNKKVVD